jgi:hypothetical protein
VSVRFPVSPTCDISHLIVDVVARLGGSMNDGGSGGSEMVVRAWDRSVIGVMAVRSNIVESMLTY